MGKLPVFATVSRTYGFLLGDFPAIFRLAWGPLAAVAVLNFYFGAMVLDAASGAAKDPSAALAMAPTNMLLGLVSFLFSVMALVALLRVVIEGDRKPGLPVWFWLGAAEFRLIGVYVLLLIALIAAAVGAGLVFAVLAALAGSIPGFGVIFGLAGVALVLTMFWPLLRLTLVPAVVVAERNLGVERSWELMKGNAIRMFFVLLLTFVPFVLITMIAVFAIIGSDFPPLPSFAMPGGGEVAATPKPEELRAAMEKWQMEFIQAMRAHWVEFGIFSFVSNLFQIALFAGVSGNAYTALAGGRG